METQIEKLKFIKLFCIDLLLKENYENEKINDPITKLFFSYNEITNVLNFEDPRSIKYLFFNRIIINKILYNEEQIIFIKKKFNKLNSYFYLNLLINDNKDIINYTYSLDFIKEINTEQNNQNEDYKLFINAKIIIELINNHKQYEDYNEEENEELDLIINQNKLIIKEKINIFKEIGLNWNENEINKKKIDEIYIEIINALIKCRKFNDENNVIDIIEQLDLENIHLTKKMLDNLNNFLKINEIVILNNYKIYNLSDFDNEIKINFYYILFKYIIKNPIYIIQIPFLLEIRKRILENIKYDLNQTSLSFIKNYFQKNDKIKYIINMITGSEYYFEKCTKQINNISSFFGTDYKNMNQNQRAFDDMAVDQSTNHILDKDYDSDFISKSSLIGEIMKQSNIYFIVEPNKSKNISNDDFEKICYFNKMVFKDSTGTTYKTFKMPLDKNKDPEFDDDYYVKLFLNYKKFINFLENIRKIFITKIKDSNLYNLKLEIILDIKEINDKKENLNYINCKYILSDPKIIDKNYEDINILIKEKYENFELFVSDIIKKKSANIEKKQISSSLEISTSLAMNSKNNINSSNIGDINSKIININKDNNELKKNEINDENKKEINGFSGHEKIKGKSGILNDESKELIKFLNDQLEEWKYQIRIENGKIKEKIDINQYKYEKNTKLGNNLEQLIGFIRNIESIIEKGKPEINLEINLNFKANNLIIEASINQNEYKNINCEYKIINGENETNIGEKFTDIDILNNNSIENLNRFFGLLKNKISNNNSISLPNSSTDMHKIFLSSNNSQNYMQINNQSFSSNLIDFIKLLGKHKKGANYILELENGYLISGGPKSIILYDNINYSNIKEIKKDHYSICPVKNEKGNIDLVINREDGIYASSFNNNTIEEFFRKIKSDTNSMFCFNLNKSFLVCNKEGFFQFNDILGKIIEIKGNLIFKQQFFGGIKINDYIIALTSNKSSPKGEDKIIFYNNNSKKIFKDIKEYSFTKSQNNLTLISIENESNKKLLLCACTKYVENQKNGILLIKIQFDDREEEKTLDIFYETTFEVHCFCPIFFFENDNHILEKKNKKLIYTKFFFVCGYDKNKKEGLIKLYKYNYNEKDFDKTEIEYIKDIEIENENKKIIFKGPINCMIQSQKTGKIILTSLDGNVYLFSSPNINQLNSILINKF